MRRISRLLLGAAFVVGIAGSAHATAIDASIGGPWLEFLFGGPGLAATDCAGGCVPSSGGNSIDAGGPPWTYTSLGSTLVTVTDAFTTGDSFSLFDFGALIGSTPSVAVAGGFETDPAITSLDPTYSHASFVLGPGLHSLTITALDSPYGNGAAYFRVDFAAVPEPSTLLLLALGLAGLAARRLRP